LDGGNAQGGGGGGGGGGAGEGGGGSGGQVHHEQTVRERVQGGGSGGVPMPVHYKQNSAGTRAWRHQQRRGCTGAQRVNSAGSVRCGELALGLVHYEQTVRPRRWRLPVHYEQTVSAQPRLGEELALGLALAQGAGQVSERGVLRAGPHTPSPSQLNVGTSEGEQLSGSRCWLCRAGAYTRPLLSLT